MTLDDIKSVYFVGAGGIGMSALERYFLAEGKCVAGYDRTSCELTETLRKEGADIHYEDNVELIPECCRDKATTLVVFTPAIPADHKELAYFRNNGFEVPSTHPGLTYFRDGGFDVMKRAQVLGLLTRHSKGLCVAGTHGKTTTSTMLAHLLHQSHVECNAFLGGISKNSGTNFLLSEKSPYVALKSYLSQN